MILKDGEKVLGYLVILSPDKMKYISTDKALICPQCYESIRGEKTSPEPYYESDLSDGFETIICDRCGLSIKKSKKDAGKDIKS